ncbi:PEP-CTERM sorting domain-containing protein [uncultured Thiodictyon sp.]|uniref:PEP-CTERM sorting domain-containing protein n=1 Tax=uncultured Thiodictyon sp. TaxID=1846217 RepID=UPI0025FC9936|nr:PEP-CTERM sorting domain-containing protein [uncultured Thiodictyon sp.]
MRRSIAPTLLLAGALALPVTAPAGVIFTLLPTSGEVAGDPGDTVGWGFTLSNDTAYWLWANGSVFDLDKGPSWGTYDDYSGNSDPVAPGTAQNPTVLTVLFSLLDGTGAGSFAIDPTVPFGDQATGVISLDYDIYDANPSGGGLDPIDSARVQADAVVTSTPEAGTWTLLGLGLAALGGGRRRRSAARHPADGPDPSAAPRKSLRPW